MAPIKNDATFYKFDVANLPDELYNEKVPVDEWLKQTTTTSDEKGFAPQSLNQVHSIPLHVELERTICVPLYMMGNVLPFVLPSLILASFYFDAAIALLGFITLYTAILAAIQNLYFIPYFLKNYQRSGKMGDNIKDNQYIFTERNNAKFNSVKYVWPKSLHRPNMKDTPMIFCAVPHGVYPVGVTSYPLWSKLWNDKLCRWTCAPVLFNIPFVGFFMKKIGYLPAKSKHILDTLTKKEENVGVFLDGIAGMFQTSGKEEKAYLKNRKGIVKIALRAGAPLVPVYGFGHSNMYTVLVDPFGILEWLSIKLEVSLTPFFGRFGWFLGPPSRVPVAICVGEPVRCPQIDEPTKEQVNEWHQKLLDAYTDLFETHKRAYGWENKTLRFV